MSGAVCQAMQIQMQNDLHLDPHTLSPFLKHAGHVDSLQDIEEEEWNKMKDWQGGQGGGVMGWCLKECNLYEVIISYWRGAWHTCDMMQ